MCSSDLFIRHKNNVSSFNGSIGTQSAHSNTDIGPRQYGSVIDTIPNKGQHTFFAFLLQQAFHAVNLISGQQFSINLIQMKLPCDFLSNGICIAGQHDRFADTGRFQQLDCGWSIGLDLVLNDPCRMFMGRRFGQSTRNILAWYTIVTILISWLALTLC